MEQIVDKIIKTTYDDLKNISINSHEKTGLIVSIGKYKYEFIIKIVDNNDEIIVFSPNYTNKDKNNKPLFSYHEWIDDIKQNVIFFNDPSIYDLKNVTGGWGIGNEKTWHLKNIAKIIEKLTDTILDYSEFNLPNKNNNIFFYGNSMGGFMAIALSLLVEKSTCIAENPQIDLSTNKYWDKISKECFKNLTKEKINNYSYRYNIVDLIKQKHKFPNCYLIFDNNDKKWDKQYKYFLDNINNFPYQYNKDKNQINIKFNSKFEKTSKYETLNLIDNIINLESKKTLFNPNKLQMIDEFYSNIQDNYKKYKKNIITFYDFQTFIKNYLKVWKECRIDVKNIGSKTNKIIIENDENLKYDYPSWYKSNKGEGLTISDIQSTSFKLKCINKGKLRIKLRGPFYCDDKKVTKPIFVNYEKFKINDNFLFSRDLLLWHDDIFINDINCTNNEVFNINIEYSTIFDYYPYTELLLKDLITEEDKIVQNYDNLKQYIEYIKMVNKPF